MFKIIYTSLSQFCLGVLRERREEGQREARKIIGEKTEPYHSEAQLVQHHLDCTFNKHGAIYKGELFWGVYLS